MDILESFVIINKVKFSKSNQISTRRAYGWTWNEYLWQKEKQRKTQRTKNTRPLKASSTQYSPQARATKES